jgi:hypothetical protein
MCESEGFLAPSDSGKQVRCVNPECIVPIFKSPETKKTVESKPVQKAGWPMHLKVGVPVLAIAFGAAIWFFLSSGDSGNVELPPFDIPTPMARNTGEEEAPEATVQKTPAAQGRTLSDIVNELASGAAALADERRPANRSQEYARQLATEIQARSHRLAAAQATYANLEKITRRTTFYRIEPLIELGWQALAEGKRPQAEQYAKDAQAIILDPALPTAVRRTLDGEVATIALLVKLDLLEQALPLLERNSGATPRSRMSLLWTCAAQGGSHNLDFEAARLWHMESPAPVWQAVIETLVSRGDASRALTLCNQAPDQAAKDAAYAAWAGRVTLRAAESGAPAEVQQVLGNSETSLTARIRMHAAVADARLAKGDKATAAQQLTQALALTEQLGQPSPVPLPDLRTIFNSQGKPRAGLADPAPVRARVLAVADLAFLQLRSGQTAEGWQTLERALSWARAMAPSPAATQALLDDVDKANIKTQLMAIAPRNSKDVLVVGQYRRQCQALHDEAVKRFELQVGWLQSAALQGQLAQVWQYARDREQATGAEREPYLTGERPPLLSLMLTQADVLDRKLAAEMRTYRGDKPVTPSTLDWARANLPGLLAKSDTYPQAAEAIRREQKESADAKAAPFLLDEIVLANLSRIQAQAPPAAFIELVRLMEDPTTKEDAFRLYGAYSATQNKLEPVLQAVQANRAIEVTHKLALHRGIVDALP